MLLNLEPVCAKHGFNIVSVSEHKDIENIVTKALGVLAENGLYSMALFLVAGSKKEISEVILTKHLRALWQCDELQLLAINVGAKKEDVLTGVRTMCEDIETMIMAKRVTESCLTFARYHAKAQ